MPALALPITLLRALGLAVDNVKETTAVHGAAVLNPAQTWR